MKAKWWRHPEMILVYGALGSFAGVVCSFVVCSAVQAWGRTNSAAAAEGFGTAYSGVSGVFLLGELIAFDAVLGAATGGFAVHVFGKYSLQATWGLVLSGCLGALASVAAGLQFAGSYGREGALATYAVYFVWSLDLLLWGLYLLGQEAGSRRSDLQ